VFLKNAEIVSGSESRQQIARKLMTKIVNSLSVKMEHGAPMINMYLLQNPDHYCSHNFRNCYWQAFVTAARSSWVANVTTDQNVEKEATATQVIVLKQGKRVVGLSPILDYVWRPQELELLSLYDWIINCTREKRKNQTHASGNQSDGHVQQNSDEEYEPKDFVKSEKLLLFASEHPLAETHGVCWLSNKQKCVPNFLGPTLPRPDHGDRDYYCSTMLAFFKPWHSGYDLKTEESTWEEAFDKYVFMQHDHEVMQNVNICYECLDSLDDFHSQMKKETVGMPRWTDDQNIWQQLNQTTADDEMDNNNTLWNDMLVAESTGKKECADKEIKTAMRCILTESGWTNVDASMLPSDLNLNPEEISVLKSSTQWKALVAECHAQVLQQRNCNCTLAETISVKHALWSPDCVAIVTKDHMLSSFFFFFFYINNL
jgi:hypothetical protein